MPHPVRGQGLLMNYFSWPAFPPHQPALESCLAAISHAGLSVLPRSCGSRPSPPINRRSQSGGAGRGVAVQEFTERPDLEHVGDKEVLEGHEFLGGECFSRSLERLGRPPGPVKSGASLRDRWWSSIGARLYDTRASVKGHRLILGFRPLCFGGRGGSGPVESLPLFCRRLSGTGRPSCSLL